MIWQFTDEESQTANKQMNNKKTQGDMISHTSDGAKLWRQAISSIGENVEGWEL